MAAHGPQSSPFSTLHLELSSTVDRVADELRRAVFDGELESGTAAARGRARRVAGRLPADRPRGARRPGRRGAGHPRAQPRRLGLHPRPRLGARHLPGPAGARGRRAYAAGPTPTSGCGTPCAPRWCATPSAVRAGGVVPGAQRAAPRLPRLPGRAHRLAPAGRDGREPDGRAQARAGPGRPDPAQRPRPGRHPHRAGDAARARRRRRARRRSSSSTSTTPRRRSSTRWGSDRSEPLPRVRPWESSSSSGGSPPTSSRSPRPA